MDVCTHIAALAVSMEPGVGADGVDACARAFVVAAAAIAEACADNIAPVTSLPYMGTGVLPGIVVPGGFEACEVSEYPSCILMFHWDDSMSDLEEMCSA